WPLIESDAAASFGDSGGAALDARGRLMGIVRGGLAGRDGRSTVVVTPAGVIGAYLRRGWLVPPEVAAGVGWFGAATGARR
ncbi:MAG: hypothetical protein NZ518_07265, partial [Dehalococcoidia bacterium]|nr:hypothetical protein [Dehalococcoidia bacterium]